MNWGARAAWVYENTMPDVAKAKQHSIEVVYIDPRSTNAKAAIASIEGAGLLAGAYVASGWYGDAMDGVTFAGRASNLANAVIPRVGTAEAPPLMLDLEGRSQSWIAHALVEYRRHQPARPTAVTTEPFKDGTVLPMQGFRDAKVHWYPQLYHGDMSPADHAAVVLDAARWLGDATLVHPFYDGAALPGDARDGAVFTLERIP